MIDKLLPNLDLRAIFRTLALPVIFWVAAVLVITIFQFPGVVCVTPVGWLLAVPVGRDVVSHTRSTELHTRKLEAGIAGGLLGFFQGGLFMLVILFGMELFPKERFPMIVLGSAVLLVGILVCAVLSSIFAGNSNASVSVTLEPTGVSTTQLCPICENAMPINPGYPNSVCADCLQYAVDTDGQPLIFLNETNGDGFRVVYADNGEGYSGHLCIIRNVLCQIEKVDFGGIVAIPVPEQSAN
jgi:hypothetical protein